MFKIQYGLNHCRCIGHTSNKVDSRSPDIIPTGIEEKI